MAYIYSRFIAIFFFLIISISTRINVHEGEIYYSKNEVSLYVLRYGELPGNFITKNEATSVFSTYYTAIENGFNIGGDTFGYYGTITSMTSTVSLKECDIYRNRDTVIDQQNRGKYRLVYSSDGNEVFYTRDHYVSFSQITNGNIQSTSTIFWLVFIFYDFGIGFMYFFAQKKEYISKEEIIIDAKKLISTTISIFALPFIIGGYFIKKGKDVIAYRKGKITK